MSPANDGDLGLSDVLAALRRRWYVFVAVLVLALAVAYAYSKSQDKVYSTSATVLFEDPNLSSNLIDAPPTSNDSLDRVAETNRRLASLPVVRARVLAANPDLQPGDISVSVGQTPTSNVATVTATSGSPALAARVANAYADEFANFARDSQVQSLKRTLALLRARIRELRAAGPGRSAELSRLKRREEDLANLSAVQTGNVFIVGEAPVPGAPSSPNTKRNVAAGGLLGLLLGAALALLLDRIDRRLRDADEIADQLGAEVLAVIPQSKGLTRLERSASALAPEDGEVFRLLRAQLRYLRVSADASTVMVTSPSAGDGKSTVAWNLALFAAEAGMRTLLIEADLRAPSLEERVEGTGSGHGLSRVLSGQEPFDQAVRRYEQLDVLFAGPKPPNASAMMESPAMHELLVHARGAYDLVVVDTAPLLAVADAIPLIDRVDGLVVVSRVRHTKRPDLVAFRELLHRLDAAVFGVVINGGARQKGYGVYAGSGAPTATVWREEEPAGAAAAGGPARDSSAS